MTKRKIRELTSLTTADDLDLIPIVDIDEPILNLQTKKITVANLLDGLGGGITSPLSVKGDIWTYDTDNARLPVGTDGQILSANSATATGLEWIVAPTGGSGEPYFDVNSSGTIATATGPEGIAIGPGSSIGSGATNSIAIGLNSVINSNVTNAIKIASSAAPTLSADNAIMIGNEARSASANSIVIGLDANAGSLNDSVIVIGDGAVATSNLADDSVAIGNAASVSGASSIAIGNSATAIGAGAVQIGGGTNTETNTLNFRANRIANAEGLYTSFTAPTNYTPADDDNITSHLTAIDTALGAGGGEDFFVDNYGADTLPTATGTSSLAIGAQSNATANTSTVVGYNSDANAISAIVFGNNLTVSGARSIAIGNQSTSINSSDDCLAIGSGSIIAAGSPNSIIIGHDSSIALTNSRTLVIGHNSSIGSGCIDSILIGANSTGTSSSNSVLLGSNSNTNAARTTAIGYNTSSTTFGAVSLGADSSSSGSSSIAVGKDAIASADNAVQLGAGTNNTISTLQYLTNTIANSDGIQIPYQTTGVAPTSTPADGSLALDNNGGTTTLWARANGAWVALISV